MKRWLAGMALGGTFGCLALGCVARGSRVRTPRGARNIEDLVEGDEVLCAEPSTARLATAKLTAIRRATRECVGLHLASTGLVLTSDHPVYCPESGAWAPAGDWALGQRTHVLTFDGETARSSPVERAVTFAGVHDVFDLTVDHPWHSFIANGVLVHNKSQPLVPCRGADGGIEAPGDACTCANGTPGFFDCQLQGQPAVCTSCQEPATDGGTPDGGP